MKYIYTSIIRLEGISDNNLNDDKIVYQDQTHDLTVILTNDLNRHCQRIDIGSAIAISLFQGIFSEEKINELPSVIDAEVLRIQENRGQNKKPGCYAVIIIKGDANLNVNEATHRETDNFRVCFDAIDKNTIKNQHKKIIQSIVASLSISTSPEYYAQKTSSGMYFVDEDNKPLYNFTMEVGRPRVIVSSALDAVKENEIAQTIKLSIGNKQLKTPFRLYSQSIEYIDDNLRSFISAWTALEIFTNKVFSSYEEQFISEIVGNHDCHGATQFLMRIKDVMKDKYRLNDKFSLIASFLSDETSKDIELFKSLKKLRDDISHGNEFDEDTLPLDDVRKLTAKYLKSHMLAISTKL